MNKVWVELSKPLIGILVFVYSAFLIGTLYVSIGGGVKGSSPLFNAGIIFVLLIFDGILIYGGAIVFRFILSTSTDSRIYLERFLRSGKSLSRWDRTFIKSCRHISMYFGMFFELINPSLPLLIFGFIVENTIDLLLIAG